MDTSPQITPTVVADDALNDGSDFELGGSDSSPTLQLQGNQASPASSLGRAIEDDESQDSDGVVGGDVIAMDRREVAGDGDGSETSDDEDTSGVGQANDDATGAGQAKGASTQADEDPFAGLDDFAEPEAAANNDVFDQALDVFGASTGAGAAPGEVEDAFADSDGDASAGGNGGSGSGSGGGSGGGSGDGDVFQGDGGDETSDGSDGEDHAVVGTSPADLTTPAEPARDAVPPATASLSDSDNVPSTGVTADGNEGTADASEPNSPGSDTAVSGHAGPVDVFGEASGAGGGVPTPHSVLGTPTPTQENSSVTTPKQSSTINISVIKLDATESDSERCRKQAAYIQLLSAVLARQRALSAQKDQHMHTLLQEALRQGKEALRMYKDADSKLQDSLQQLATARQRIAELEASSPERKHPTTPSPASPAQSGGDSTPDGQSVSTSGDPGKQGALSPELTERLGEMMSALQAKCTALEALNGGEGASGGADGDVTPTKLEQMLSAKADTACWIEVSGDGNEYSVLESKEEENAGGDGADGGGGVGMESEVGAGVVNGDACSLMLDCPMLEAFKRPPPLSVQWYRSLRGSNFHPIPGYMGQNRRYVPTVDDIGSVLKCVVFIPCQEAGSRSSSPPTSGAGAGTRGFYVEAECGPVFPHPGMVKMLSEHVRKWSAEFPVMAGSDVAMGAFHRRESIQISSASSADQKTPGDSPASTPGRRETVSSPASRPPPPGTRPPGTADKPKPPPPQSSPSSIVGRMRSPTGSLSVSPMPRAELGDRLILLNKDKIKLRSHKRTVLKAIWSPHVKVWLAPNDPCKFSIAVDEKGVVFPYRCKTAKERDLLAMCIRVFALLLSPPPVGSNEARLDPSFPATLAPVKKAKFSKHPRFLSQCLPEQYVSLLYWLQLVSRQAGGAVQKWGGGDVPGQINRDDGSKSAINAWGMVSQRDLNQVGRALYSSHGPGLRALLATHVRRVAAGGGHAGGGVSLKAACKRLRKAEDAVRKQHRPVWKALGLHKSKSPHKSSHNHHHRKRGAATGLTGAEQAGGGPHTQETGASPASLQIRVDGVEQASAAGVAGGVGEQASAAHTPKQKKKKKSKPRDTRFDDLVDGGMGDDFDMSSSEGGFWDGGQEDEGGKGNMWTAGGQFDLQWDQEGEDKQGDAPQELAASNAQLWTRDAAGRRTSVFSAPSHVLGEARQSVDMSGATVSKLKKKKKKHKHRKSEGTADNLPHDTTTSPTTPRKTSNGDNNGAGAGAGAGDGGNTGSDPSQSSPAAANESHAQQPDGNLSTPLPDKTDGDRPAAHDAGPDGNEGEAGQTANERQEEDDDFWGDDCFD